MVSAAYGGLAHRVVDDPFVRLPVPLRWRIPPILGRSSASRQVPANPNDGHDESGLKLFELPALSWVRLGEKLLVRTGLDWVLHRCFTGGSAGWDSRPGQWPCSRNRASSGALPACLHTSMPPRSNRMKVGTRPPPYSSRTRAPGSEPTSSLMTSYWSLSSRSSLSTSGFARRQAIQ